MKMEKVEDVIEGSSGKTGQPQGSGGSLVALSIKAGQVRPTGHPERESEGGTCQQLTHRQKNDQKVESWAAVSIRMGFTKAFFKGVPTLHLCLIPRTTELVEETCQGKS